MSRLREGKKIIMAETFTIDEYHDIAREFLDTVFDVSYDECFISDESKLSDFSVCCVPEDYKTPDGLSRQDRFDHLFKIGNEEMIKMIKEKYDIDVDTNDYLIAVFEKIQQKRNITLN